MWAALVAAAHLPRSCSRATAAVMGSPRGARAPAGAPINANWAALKAAVGAGAPRAPRPERPAAGGGARPERMGAAEGPTPVLAVDCEMVGLGPGGARSSLARRAPAPLHWGLSGRQLPPFPFFSGLQGRGPAGLAVVRSQRLNSACGPPSLRGVLQDRRAAGRRRVPPCVRRRAARMGGHRRPACQGLPGSADAAAPRLGAAAARRGRARPPHSAPAGAPGR